MFKPIARRQVQRAARDITAVRIGIPVGWQDGDDSCAWRRGARSAAVQRSVTCCMRGSAASGAGSVMHDLVDAALQRRGATWASR